MNNTYYQQKDFWKIYPDTLYYWQVRYSRNFRNGFDGSFQLKSTIPDLLNYVVSFFNSHLRRDEKVILSVFNTNNVEEIEAIITSDLVVYLNGLSEFLQPKSKAEY